MNESQTQKVLTVSVAAYNAEDYLREVLDSFVDIPLMDQIEVFVIDDGGQDSSLDIAKEYQSRFPNVFRPIHKENGGWGSTVNYSIRHATGKYFRLLDGDDYYHKENFNQFIAYLMNHDADIFSSSYATFRDGSDEAEEIFTPDPSFEEGKKYRLREIKKSILLPMHTVTVRTSLLQNNNVELKERCLYRDMEFTANVLTYAESVMFYKAPVYFYRLGREGQSVSKASYLKHIDEHADIVCSILEISEKPENSEKRLFFYDLAGGACLQQYLIYFYSRKTEKAKERLVAFDQKMKEYPDFYRTLDLPSHIRILAQNHFFGYSIVMWLLDIRRKIRGKEVL